jgi:hypothetical protein
MGFNGPYEPPRWKVEDFLTGFTSIKFTNSICFCRIVKVNSIFSAMKSHGVKEVGIEARAINDGSYVGRRE